MFLLFPHGCHRHPVRNRCHRTLDIAVHRPCLFFNDTITVAVWTGFHARLIHILPRPSNGRAAMGGMMEMAVLFAGASPLYPRKRTCGACHTSMRSIKVGSSPAAFELLTLRDTGYIWSDL